LKPRFFISSVVEGFGNYRDAARQGVAEGGGAAVLVNEDMSPSDSSPRNACLDGVASADAYIGIIGSRGGWTTPSGKLATEEEYEHAILLGKPVLVFLQETGRDADADRFAERLSSYTSGHLRSTFASPADLRSQIAAAVQRLAPSLGLPLTSESEITSHLKPSNRYSQETRLGLVIGPERQEDVIDPVQFDDRAFRDLVMRVGHDSSVALLDYGFPKDQTIVQNVLITEQRGSGRDYVSEARIEISESGIIVFEGNVTGRTPRTSSADLLATMVVAEEDIEAVAASMFRFYGRLFDEIDTYQRHESFVLNSALYGLGYRTIMRNPKPRHSHPVRMVSGDVPLVAFERPRRIPRAILRAPDDEARRIATMLGRNSVG